MDKGDAAEGDDIQPQLRMLQQKDQQNSRSCILECSLLNTASSTRTHDVFHVRTTQLINIHA